eukprot:TRINITY_DN1533_c0_g1_i1.p1 TRINITY_DN1533_c0_g1~~TRINITY_DN1533_c0_g1_i1.p1  ORF type:complete len:219 (+),score=38.62 TRINITY_DN1533_c0_g1_i1:1-657(+)
MRFKFCGGLDAPDWFLQEIASLALISSVRFKLILIVVIKHLLGAPMDYEKINKYLSIMEYNTSQVKGCITASTFIITQGVKYDVEAEVIKTELQQLGLPKEHCTALARPFQKYKDKLAPKFESEVLSFPRLKNVEWRVDYILCSNQLRSIEKPEAQIKIVTTKRLYDTKSQEKEKKKNNVNEDNLNTYVFTLSHDKVRILLHELKEARDLMNQTQQNK